jgi:hypothetical protein
MCPDWVAAVAQCGLDTEMLPERRDAALIWINSVSTVSQ